MRLPRISSIHTVAVTVALFAVTVNMQGEATSPAKPTPSAESDDVIALEKFEVKEIRDFADQAVLGKTPVAFTEFSKEKIVEELGSRDIPLVLNSSPSFYATTDGGGTGDSRMNIRGFDQTNISTMVNGVPVNDMENNKLYWSNWDGVGDISSLIQVQRGLSNVTLPTPSIGGTMNITTDPAGAKRGITVKYEVGYDNFMKGTIVANSGLLKDKFALTLSGVGKTADKTTGINGTWTKASAYYIGAMYRVNANNRLEFYALGAPQRHGQRSFASNIAAYDTDLARRLGYSETDIGKAAAVGAVNSGNSYNPNVNGVSPSYTGRQFWDGSTHERYEATSINERENYFHKPQINLNWFSTLNDQMKLVTVLYYSGGVGGGSGTMANGSGIAYETAGVNAGAVNWDKTIAANAGSFRYNGTTAKTPGQSVGILRNSVNKQGQIGIVSKLNYQMTDAVKFTTGVDWRTYHADHYQEVRDLLGGNYYIATTSQDSDFWSGGAAGTPLGLGDKVGYFYRSDVDWLGGFFQGQYDQGPWHAFGTIGCSGTVYENVDYFHKDPNSGAPIRLKTSVFTGSQIKGGVSYSITDKWSVFTNMGWVSRAPIFTTAIDTFNSKLVNNPANETFNSIEAGTEWGNVGGDFHVKGNVYNTEWRNRSSVSSAASTVSYRRGINANYSGVELELTYKPYKWVKFDGAYSISKWKYTSDARVETYSDNGNALISSGTLYINDLKVGEAPQTQAVTGITFYPAGNNDFSFKIEGRWYDRYWSDYDPTTRTVSTDRGQPWQIPNYSVFDIHVNCKLPISTEAVKVTAFLHIFNVLDKVYVTESTDNSAFEAISTAPSHSAQRAEVFLGTPFTVNVGVKVTF